MNPVVSHVQVPCLRGDDELQHLNRAWKRILTTLSHTVARFDPHDVTTRFTADGDAVTIAEFLICWQLGDVNGVGLVATFLTSLSGVFSCLFSPAQAATAA